MDIFPESNDDRSMQSRRNLMIRAARFTGLALATSVIESAAPLVRLEGEIDTARAELLRHQREVDNMFALLELRPPEKTRTLVCSTWANLTGLSVDLPDVWILKARTALLGGVNAVTLKDPFNGAKWFSLATSYALRSGRTDLTALIYARRALAGLYWQEPANGLRVRFSTRGMDKARESNAKGAALMAHSRVLAAMNMPDEALSSARGAIELATADYGCPRVDDWQLPLALLMACQALARFPSMGLSVETWGQQALAMVPPDATHYRTHIHLDVAQVRVIDGDLEGALPHLSHAVGNHMAPVHIDRATEVLRAADPRYYNAHELRGVREKLTALKAR